MAHVAEAQTARRIGARLPEPPQQFAGREAELARLREEVGRPAFGARPAAGDDAAEHEELDLTVDRVELDELVRLVLAGELHNGALVAAVLAARVALDGPGLDSLRPALAPWPARPFE